MILLPYNPGDIVTLKSGGPRMTVERVDIDVAECVWFDSDDNGQWHGPFRAKLLMGVLVKDEDEDDE